MNYSGAHDSKMNRDFVKAFEAQSGGLPPTFGGVGVYDAFTAMYKVLAAQKADRSGQDDGAREAAQVREPARSDRDRSDTRDIVQNVYIRRTELKGGQLVNTEIDTYRWLRILANIHELRR